MCERERLRFVFVQEEMWKVSLCVGGWVEGWSVCVCVCVGVYLAM